MIADAWAPFPSDPSAAEPHRATRETEVHGPGTPRETAEKDRPIDPMCGKNTPAWKEPEPVSSFCSGRAPALHACDCLTTPAFESYPFVSPVARRMAAAFRRARESAIHPATITVPRFRFYVKEFQKKVRNGFVRLVDSGDGPLSYGTAIDVGAIDPKLRAISRHCLSSGQVESASLPNACSPDIFWTIR